MTTNARLAQETGLTEQELDNLLPHTEAEAEALMSGCESPTQEELKDMRNCCACVRSGAWASYLARVRATNPNAAILKGSGLLDRAASGCVLNMFVPRNER